MVSESTFVTFLLVLALLTAGAAVGWWIGAHSRRKVLLDLYCTCGGFWHRGVHYDIRRSTSGMDRLVKIDPSAEKLFDWGGFFRPDDRPNDRRAPGSRNSSPG